MWGRDCTADEGALTKNCTHKVAPHALINPMHERCALVHHPNNPLDLDWRHTHGATLVDPHHSLLPWWLCSRRRWRLNPWFLARWLGWWEGLGFMLWVQSGFDLISWIARAEIGPSLFRSSGCYHLEEAQSDQPIPRVNDSGWRRERAIPRGPHVSGRCHAWVRVGRWLFRSVTASFGPDRFFLFSFCFFYFWSLISN
jgi:hypothetical protein